MLLKHIIQQQWTLNDDIATSSFSNGRFRALFKCWSFTLSRFDQIGNLSYYVVSSNATKIKCEFNGKTSEDNNNFKFIFEIKDDSTLTTATFTSICSDDVNGVACEITYPAPKRSGFHLIEYPNRDRTSITGRGFYRELIPVEA